MKTIQILALSIALGGTATSCNKVGCVKGNGTVTTETREVDGFDKIEVSCSADVYLYQDSVFSVEIEGESNIIPYVTTKVWGNTLDIDMKNNFCYKGSKGIDVRIGMPELRGVEVSGSSDVYGKEIWDCNDLAIDISGSGNVQFYNMEANDMTINISGSGDIDLAGLGTASSINMKISGSGNLDLYDFKANDVDVDISGSGTAKIHVLNQLNAEISGSGDVIYKGSPSVTSKITGSGDVRPY